MVANVAASGNSLVRNVFCGGHTDTDWRRVFCGGHTGTDCGGVCFVLVTLILTVAACLIAGAVSYEDFIEQKVRLDYGQLALVW